MAPRINAEFPSVGRSLLCGVVTILAYHYRVLCKCLHNLTYHISNLVDWWGAVFCVWSFPSSHLALTSGYLY
jgi:hypothetical protein